MKDSRFVSFIVGWLCGFLVTIIVLSMMGLN